MTRRARDVELLDAVDAFRREPFASPVWRVTREGRDPAIGSPSNSRWCNGSFDVLYCSLQADGALAEVYSYLSLQPVFPSKPVWFLRRLAISCNRALRLADKAMLHKLGVDVSRYHERTYEATQAIADAAYFLDFDGIIAPSARFDCLNVVLFTEKVAIANIEVVDTGTDPIDWASWRKGTYH